MYTFIDNSHIQWVMNPVVAGTTDQNSSSIDMIRGETVTFIAKFGTLTASAVTGIKAQGSTDDTNWVDLAGTALPIAVADTGKALALEINKPPAHRYVRAVVTRGTANAVIDGVVAIVTHARVGAVTQGSTMAGVKTVAGPVAGTP
jgi:hypothetical protein